jgi:hypothetical protein
MIGHGADLKINIYSVGEHNKSTAREIMVEYAPSTQTVAGAA